MSKVEINLQNTMQIVNEQLLIAKEVEALSDEIELLKNVINFRLLQKYKIQKTLACLAENTRQQSYAVSDFSDKLETIVSLYLKTEAKIIENANGVDEADELMQLSKDYDKTTKTFDDDRKNGTYGADQGNMANNKKGSKILWW